MLKTKGDTLDEPRVKQSRKTYVCFAVDGYRSGALAPSNNLVTMLRPTL